MAAVAQVEEVQAAAEGQQAVGPAAVQASRPLVLRACYPRLQSAAAAADALLLRRTALLPAARLALLGFAVQTAAVWA